MRPIDADVVLAGINQIWDANPAENPYTDFGQALDSVSETVEMAPTIDPVKHGKWVNNGDGSYTCTNCKRRMSKAAFGYPFAPCCGAKMDGDAHD